MAELSPEQWGRIQEVFDEVADLPPNQRTTYLKARFAGETTVRVEVESLLRVHDDANTFLDSPHVVHFDSAAGLTESIEIERYTLTRRIGAGGMGVVYLAERDDDTFFQRVAVKVLRGGLHTDDLIRRFRVERQALANLQHPNIARLLDGGATRDGRPYLIMEYIDGDPLDRYCRDHDLSIPQRIELFAKVCAAVAHAHRNLIVHRDLKPSNILVTSDGEPKLLDFGVAKILDPDVVRGAAPVTETIGRPFTPRYASPEQIRGGHITTVTDVYALGVILYELLADCPMVDIKTGNMMELDHLICVAEPKRPSVAARAEATDTTSLGQSWDSLSRSMRGDIDTIVMKALRKEPEHRYASVEGLQEDLRRYLASEPLLARPASTAYHFRKYLTRRRGTLLSALAGSTIAILFAVAVFFGVVIMPRWSEAAQREAHTILLAAEQQSAMYDAVFFLGNPRNPNVWKLVADMDEDILRKAVRVLDRGIKFAPFDRDLRRQRDVILAAAHLRWPLYALHNGRDVTLPAEFLELLDPKVAALLEHPDPSSQLEGLSPEHVRDLGLLLVLANPSRESIEVLRSYEALVDPDPLIEGLLGQLYLILGHDHLAYPRIRAAYEAYPESTAITLSLAEAACGAGDVGRASRLVMRAELRGELDQWDRISRVRARIAARSGSEAEARAAYAHATRCHGPYIELFQSATGKHYNPVACYEYGRYLDHQGDLDAAVYWLARGAVSNSKDLSISAMVAMAAYVDCVERWVASWSEEQLERYVRELTGGSWLDVEFDEFRLCDPPEIDTAFHFRLYTACRKQLLQRPNRIAISDEEAERFAAERAGWSQPTEASHLAALVTADN